MSATARADFELELALDRDRALARPRQDDHGATLAAIARVATACFLLVAAVLTAGIAGLALYGAAHAERIYEGVEVAGVRVGGMTETEARAALDARFAEYADQPLSLTAGDQTFAITPRQAGASLDGAASAGAAFAYGRSGSVWHRSLAWARGIFTSATVAPRVQIDPAQLSDQLRAVAPAIERAPADAFVDMAASGEPTLVAEVPGVSLDLATSGAILAAELGRLGSAAVPLVTRVAPAGITSDTLAAGLPGVRAAVDAPLVLATAEGAWSVSPEDLKRIVSVQPGQGEVVVDRVPVREFVAGIAASIDRSGVDAGLTVDETGAFAVVPQVDAARVDVEATTDDVVAALTRGTHDVDLVVARSTPAILDEHAAAAAARAEDLIDDGLMLTWQGGAARLGRDDLLQALTITPRPGEPEPFALDLDRAVLAEKLAPVAEQIFEPAVDARFRLIDGQIRVASQAATGRAIDLDRGVDAAYAAVMGHDAEIGLDVEVVKPAWTANDLPDIELGDDLLGDAATGYAGSSEPRRMNVERATELENGWLVPPGGIFSYVENVGTVDEANGFVTGYGIVAAETGGVTTAPVIGGGICQVSTTIFQAAFWAGLPIVERYEHPYWLTGYGAPPRGMTGLDAMVNIEEDWALDLKFRNTTDGWLALVMYADGASIVARILGTDPGWDIAVDEPEISNLVPKSDAMIYTESPELPRGQEMVVETAQDGFDVAITRTVSKDGEVVDVTTIASSFAPARNTTLRGTGGPS